MQELLEVSGAHLPAGVVLPGRAVVRDRRMDRSDVPTTINLDFNRYYVKRKGLPDSLGIYCVYTCVKENKKRVTIRSPCMSMRPVTPASESSATSYATSGKSSVTQGKSCATWLLPFRQRQLANGLRQPSSSTISPS